MGSKSRHQPYQRQPPSMMMNHDQFIPGPYFDMGPPPEVMEQKLIIQHGEMQKLGHENNRLASSHVVLRQDLAATQQELHRLQSQINLMKVEKEQRMKGLEDKITAMEADLRASEAVKVELQKARAEAQTLLSVREELLLRAQQLTQQLQHSHTELQQIPTLVSELDGLRREYHNLRVAYEYERKLYSDHLDSLQVMEKNYVAMLREVEKLRNELANSDRRTGGQYGMNMGYQEVEAYAPNAPLQATHSQLHASHQGRTPPGGVASHDTILGSGGGGYEVGSRGLAAGYEAAARAASMYGRNPGGAQAMGLSGDDAAAAYRVMVQAAARGGGSAHQ